MSSIIKGGRIRKETTIDLSERLNLPNDTYNHLQEESADELVHESVARVKEEIEFMHQSAELVLKKARKEAEEILSNASKEAVRIRENAELECHGLTQEALKKQENLLAQTKEECQKLLEDAQKEKRSIIEGIEDELVDTLKSLLQYLVGEEVYNNTQWLTCILKRMMAADALKSEIKVIISSNMYSKLSEKEIEVIKGFKEDVILHASDTISDTACRVESKEGSIEYNVKEGLARVISDIKILQNLKQESL